MNRSRASRPRVLAVAAMVACALLSGPPAARAKDLPSDLCSLLPASQIAKTLEQPFRPPETSRAPRAYQNTASGTECEYLSEKPTGMGVPLKVVFDVYVEASPAAARDVFTRVKAFFDKGLGPSTTVGGLGDAAYRDVNLALHVLKGRTHYSINFIPMGTFTPQKEQQEKDLASWVAAQL